MREYVLVCRTLQKPVSFTIFFAAFCQQFDEKMKIDILGHFSEHELVLSDFQYSQVVTFIRPPPI
jgi:hypothetical protein